MKTPFKAFHALQDQHMPPTTANMLMTAPAFVTSRRASLVFELLEERGFCLMDTEQV
jgi:hypothetical protein